MKGQQLRDYRKRQGLSQDALADVLNQALDRHYTSATVSAWERQAKPIPDHVAAFVDALLIDASLPPLESGPAGVSSPYTERGEDSAPPAPDDAPPAPGQQPPVSGPNAYARICTELWELVAAAVGMIGAAIGSENLMHDGKIISADKVALGNAYGKLAETNETFRRMLMGMTSGGAWLEVSLVTGMTVGKIWQNHAQSRIVAMSGGGNGHVPADFSAAEDAASGAAA